MTINTVEVLNNVKVSRLYFSYDLVNDISAVAICECFYPLGILVGPYLFHR